MTVTTAALKYPLDRTGTATTNLISNEKRSVGREVYRALAPYAGAFYTKSMTVIDATSGKTLTLNVDYKLLYPYQEAELEIGKPICTVVRIINKDITDVLLTYQVVGGPYTTARDVLAQLITDLQQDDRSVTWDAILGKPVEFTPKKHLHSATDLYGLEYVVLALEELVQATYTGDVSSHDILYDYIDRIKAYLDAQLDGLNQTDASLRAEIERLDTRIDAVITSVIQVQTNLTNHINNKSNPHGVTKTQVGLGSVENYRPATQPEAEAGTSSNTLSTPLRTWQAITKYVALNVTPVITTHVNNKSNPHGVTATQVGLANVLNSPQVIRGGGTGMLTNTIRLGWNGSNLLLQVDNSAMGSVHTTNQPDPNIASHVNNKSNPHAVTAAQVGLSNVPNYRLALAAENAAGSLDTVFTSPLGIKQFTESMRTISTAAPPSSVSGYRAGHIWWKII